MLVCPLLSLLLDELKKPNTHSSSRPPPNTISPVSTGCSSAQAIGCSVISAMALSSRQITSPDIRCGQQRVDGFHRICRVDAYRRRYGLHVKPDGAELIPRSRP